MFLSPDEIERLTGYKRAAAQARELDHMGIPYRQRRDGSLVVLLAHIEGTANIQREPRVRLFNGPPS